MRIGKAARAVQQEVERKRAAREAEKMRAERADMPAVDEEKVKELAELAGVSEDVMRKMLEDKIKQEKIAQDAEHFNMLQAAKARAAHMAQAEEEAKKRKQAEKEQAEKEKAECVVKEEKADDGTGNSTREEKVEEGWTDGVDPKSARRYYFNTITKKSQWVPPPGYMPKTATPPPQRTEKGPPPAPGTLPAKHPPGAAADWVQMPSKQFPDKKFWYNTKTGESSWSIPPCVSASALLPSSG